MSEYILPFIVSTLSLLSIAYIMIRTLKDAEKAIEDSSK